MTILTENEGVEPNESVQEVPADGGEAAVTDSAEVTEKEDTGPVGAPEEYTDFVMPDGFEADKDMLDKFKPVAKELNLTQEQAQKLVDLQATKLQEHVTAQNEAWEKLNADWTKTAETDKEYGGKNFKTNLAVASKVVKEFGTPELREALEVTGAGNHPEFIRLLYRIGQKMQNDTVEAGAKAEKPKDWASILYPTMNGN